MLNRDRFYKCMDIDSNSKKEKMAMGLMNPYGYTFDINKKKELDNNEIKTCYDDIIPQTQDKKKF